MALAGGLRLGAQSLVGTFVASTNPIPVGGSLTYTTYVTNMTGATVTGGFVTNALFGPVQITGVTETPGVFVSTNGSTLSFNLGAVLPGAVDVLTVTVTATAAGIVTNTLSLLDPAFFTTTTTNLVNQITNTFTSSDLAVSLFGPSSAVYSNDWTSYTVTVTNLGTAVTNVLLTNTLPASVGFIGISPSNSFTSASNTMVFNIGKLAGGGSTNFTVIVQPTNSGAQTISVSVGAPNFVDSNPTNNSASTNITVLDFVEGQLTATNVTAMTNNLQTGLFNQVVRLTNVGTNTVSAARLIVAGVTNLAFGKSNYLFSAVGTNNGNPFAIYGSSLDPGQSVDLVLEYYSAVSHKPFAVDNSNYIAAAIGTVDFSVAGGTNGSVLITTFKKLPDGNVLVGFRATPGKTYTIIYSDSLASTLFAAQPSFNAPANIVQWIDYGPPKTLSNPQTNSSRFYRVREGN